MKYWTIFMVLIGVSLSWGQVTIESSVTSDGFYGMGGFTSTVKTMVQGDAKRTETELKFTGAIMHHFSPKGKNIEITRLDKQVIWRFNDNEKKYTETTFEQMKQLFESGDTGYDMPEQEQENPEQEKTESEYEWQEPKYKVEKLESNVNIAGQSCDHYLATITTIGVHKQTGKQDTMLFKGDFWNSLDNSNEMKIVDDFEKRLAEALGYQQLANRGMAQFMTMYKEQAEQLQESMQKMEGYPLKMKMVYNITTHAYEAEQAQAEEADEDNSVDVSNVQNALGGLFGKKIAKMAQESITNSQQGPKVLFNSTYEVTSIKSGSIDDDKFVVPAKYKLED